MKDHIDQQAQSEQKAQYAEPPKELRSACINEAYENYKEDPCDERDDEVQYYLAELASKEIKLREIKQFCMDLWTTTDNRTAKTILDKLRGC